MRELNVNEIEQVSGGNPFYTLGRWVGMVFAPAGDVDCNIAP